MLLSHHLSPLHIASYDKVRIHQRPHTTYPRILFSLVATRFVSVGDSLAMLVNSCSQAAIRTPYYPFIPSVHFACEDVERESLFDTSHQRHNPSTHENDRSDPPTSKPRIIQPKIPSCSRRLKLCNTWRGTSRESSEIFKINRSARGCG